MDLNNEASGNSLTFTLLAFIFSFLAFACNATESTTITGSDATTSPSLAALSPNTPIAGGNWWQPAPDPTGFDMVKHDQ
jgi:hypothetical protein